MALPVTDTWSSGSTQTIAVYGAYAVLEGGFTVRSGTAGLELTNGGGTYNTARRTDETFSADQYSQVKVTSSQISNSSYCGPAVRCQSGANSSYHVETNGSEFYLSKCLSGTQSVLAGPVTQSWAAGDIIRLEVTGTGGTVTLKVYKALAASPTSFTQVGTTYTDSSSPITTAGTAGVFGYGYTEGSYSPVGEWSAGDLSAGGYTLTADGGSYTLTGASVTLNGSYRLVADAGTYNIVGADALRDFSMVAGSGTFTFTGSDVNFQKGFTLTADSGTYTYTGTSTNLLANKVITAAGGSFTLTGADVTFLGQASIAADVGTFTYTGSDVTLSVQRTITAEAGTFTLTGADVNFSKTNAYTLTADSGSYIYTGRSVNLIPPGGIEEGRLIMSNAMTIRMGL